MSSSSCWHAYECRGRCQGLWFHPCARELDGVDDDDPVAFGSDQLFGAELTKDTYHHLTNRADSVGQFPLAHKDVQFTACGHALGCKVEQVPSDPLANRRECAARNFGDKTLHAFAELGEQARAIRTSVPANRRATAGNIRTSSDSTSA